MLLIQSHGHPASTRYPITLCAEEQLACLARYAVSARGDVGRRRRQLRDLLGARDPGRAVPVRLGRRRSRVADDSAARAHRHGLARLPAGRRSRASSTATASTARTRRSTGHRFNPHKLVLDPYAKVDRPGDAVGRRRCSASASGEDDTTFDDRDSAPYAPLAAVVDTAFTWGDDRPLRTPVARDAHLRAARQGLHAAATRHVPESLRGTYLGLASEPAIRHLASLGVTAVELMPVHHHVDEWHLDAERADELLGLQHARLLRARRALRLVVVTARRRARVQDDGARAARGRPRGDPRRRLQPHRRRQSPRSDAVAARHRQHHLLPARARQLALLPGLHRHAATR